MTQRLDGQQWPEQAEAAPVWQLAAELDPSPEGARLRRKRKRVSLRLAGVLFAPDGLEDWTRGEADISGPPEPYPHGISPLAGSLHQRS